MNIHEVLKRYWGYHHFRPLQEDIIHSVLDGNDTIALLPTGGGKSICFQIPAMMKEGVCIVVSPLIALMKDQVYNLKKRGINALALYSGMTREEIDTGIDNCIYGSVKFLYVSPERLTTDIIKHRLPKMKVSLIAIDEAHCISQWGYDFRPPYLEISKIRDIINRDAPFLALTATATKDVINDISDKLELQSAKVFRKSFIRENLAYVVLNDENKQERLLKICRNVKGSGVVYVRNRRKTKEIADFLLKNKISAAYYHAGLDAFNRDKRQREWIDEKIRVIVSTNAFGMGIDKPNVRFVVHMDLPDAPEAYFQEAGRAGRDGKKAFAVSIFFPTDIANLELFLENSYPPLPFIKKVYDALGGYLQLASGGGAFRRYDFVLHEFCQRYNLNILPVFSALKILEKQGYIQLSNALEHPSRLHIKVNNEELYRFLLTNPVFDPIMKMILRSYSGLFSEYVKIQERQIAVRLKISEKEVISKLRKLHQYHILFYDQQNTKPQITFLQDRVDGRFIEISPENYSMRKKFATERVRAMKEYVTSVNICRSRLLLEYFGEKKPEECGICDVCLDKKKSKKNETKREDIREWVFEQSSGNSLTLRQLIDQSANKISEKEIIDVVQFMLDNGELVLEGEERIIKWRK